MANTVIQLKKSGTPSAQPADLANGEIAINYADGKIFYKDSTGTIKTVSVDAYSTVNVGGTLLVADIPNDVLSIGAGDNIILTPDALTDSFTVAANLTAANNWANTKLSNTSGVVFGGNLTISQDLTIGNNISNVTSIILNTSTNRTPTTPGEITWSDDDSTLRFNMDSPSSVIGHIGQDQFYYVKNQTGSTINKGTVVRFAGTLGSSGRLLVAPAIANNSYPSKYVVGVAAATINNGDDGFVLAQGKLRGINTSAFSEGDILYVSSSTPGAFSNTMPTAPNNKITIAAVVKKDNTQGTIEVRLTLGSKLNEDELVELSSLANGDVLVYNTTTGIFENKQTLVSAFNKANSANVLAKAAYDFANTLGGGGATVSNTAPVSPGSGDLWWNTDYGRLLIYYTDADSSQWVDAAPVPDSAKVDTGNTIPTSPTTGQLWWNSEYGRLFVYYDDGDSSQWVDTNPATDLGYVQDLANAAFNTANSAATYAYVNTSVAAANSYTNAAYIVANAAYGAANSAATTGKAIAMAIVFGG